MDFNSTLELIESNKSRDIEKEILDHWRDSWDVEKIVKATNSSVKHIKSVLKKNNRKGWEEL
jgi:hypothetical protein